MALEWHLPLHLILGSLGCGPFATPSLVPASETNWEASLAVVTDSFSS